MNNPVNILEYLNMSITSRNKKKLSFSRISYYGNTVKTIVSYIKSWRYRCYYLLLFWVFCLCLKIYWLHEYNHYNLCEKADQSQGKQAVELNGE